jgi:hypothetical protein
MCVTRPWIAVKLDEQPGKIHLIFCELSATLGEVNNAFIRKSTTYYTFDSVKGSPYTLSSDGRKG